MSQSQEQTSTLYTASLVASFFIGIDCFVIAMIYLVPVLGLPVAIMIALCGLILNTFVYFKSGPDSLKELFEKNVEKRSMLSYVINAVAFFGALFVFIFTIYAYMALAAVMPFLAGWLTPFLILTMALAYFIGTFTLNKSELSQDLLGQSKEKFSIRSCLRKASGYLIEILALEPTDGYATKIWRFSSRLFIPITVACVVSLAITLAFFAGCMVLLGGVGLMYLQPLIVLMACCFLFAELYFNIKQNLAMVKHICQPDGKIQQQSMFTPGMCLLILMVFANALANGFIAMDTSTMVISAIMLAKCISGVIQSFCTMLNTCWTHINDPEASMDTLMGGQTREVLTQSCLVIGVVAAVYFALIFNPMLLPMIVMAALLIIPVRQFYKDHAFLKASREDISTAKSLPFLRTELCPKPHLQSDSFLGDQNGVQDQSLPKSTLSEEYQDGKESRMSPSAK